MPRAANAYKRTVTDIDPADNAPDTGAAAQQRIVRTAATGVRPPATTGVPSVFALAQPPAKPGPGGKMPRLPTLDTSALKFEENVQMPARHFTRGGSRYAAVFAGLTKAGMSVALPRAYAGSIGSAAKKHASETGRKYAVRYMDETTVRLFRTE